MQIHSLLPYFIVYYYNPFSTSILLETHTEQALIELDISAIEKYVISMLLLFSFI